MFNRKAYKKEYRKENHKKLLIYQRQWRKNNPEKMKEQNRRYRENHLEKRKEYMEKWQKDNPKKTKQYRNTQKENHRLWMNIKRKTDLKINFNSKVSKEICISLKGNKSGRHWETIVGYTLSDLIKHLKKTIPKGYTWKDYLRGRLHIDHIIPIIAFVFNKPEDREFKSCWNLHNLRLLTKKDNLSKSKSINNPILLGLLLKEMS
ncbi:hypothetical protein ES695_04090 [Candidatus Atribacteria bacterium 1244-E10-H5-B2]|nr:MAG: hypothetical protein ES695_04090 [Candidatus Atribacteria bacterium 1244-E10-H5-B2]